MRSVSTIIMLLAGALWLGTSLAGNKMIKIYNTKTHRIIGQVTFTDTPYGLLIKPQLIDLPPGAHGMHLHEFADCGDNGAKAGGHWNPTNAKHHLGPYDDGHLGALPILFVQEDGQAIIPVLAPRLTVADLSDVSLIIHADSDTYTDTPPLGGGGARIACGVIPAVTKQDEQEKKGIKKGFKITH